MTDSDLPVSEAEREVLKALWELERATVREIREFVDKQGRKWAHTTINTLLGRLEEKGLVQRDTSGFAHVFSAALSREAMVRNRLRCLADNFCDGASAPLVLALVEGESFTKSELDEFRRLLDQLENRADNPPSQKRSRRRAGE